MAQTIQQTLQDPKFYGLPSGEQQKVLATLDPNYARLSLEERNKVLQMGKQRLGTAAPLAPPAPDFTTNSIDPSTGTGYGLYPMQGPGGTKSIPFNNVQAAMEQGYTLDRANAARYHDDLSAVPQAQKGFWASAVAPIAGTVAGAYHAVIDPPKNTTEKALDWVPAALPLKRMLVDPAVDQGRQAVSEFQKANAATPWYSPNPSPQAIPHREMALAHGLATVVPMLGPWAANVGEQEGQQIGTGNYKGAAGTAVGNTLLALAPKITGKALDVAPDAAQGLIRRLAGSGPGVATRLVRDTLEDNRKIDIQNSGIQANRTAAEHMLDLRRQHEQAYQQATSDHYAKEETADAGAKAEENSAWSAWRQKIAGKTLDGGQISGPLARLRLTSPEVDRTLNQLEPRGDEVPQESPYAQIREQAAQQQFGKDYESLSPVKQDQIDDLLHANGHSPEPIAFDPQAGQPLSIDRVQRASSILQRYIRSGRFEGPLLGEMKQVAGVLRNAVTRASADAGASAEINAARKSTITYQEAFGREHNPPSTARTVREKQVNPEAFQERADEERLARARKYDPTLVDSYRRVKAAREALDKFPTEDQLRVGLKQPTPHQTISEEDLRRANARSVRARAQGVTGYLLRLAVVWPAFRMLSELTRGEEISPKSLAVIPAAGATGMIADEIMASPPVMEFFARATKDQIARIPPDLRGQMPEFVALAKARKIPVSPILAAYASSIQRNQSGQSVPPPQPAQQGSPQ